jgi:hypothetical protein
MKFVSPDERKFNELVKTVYMNFIINGFHSQPPSPKEGVIYMYMLFDLLTWLSAGVTKYFEPG